MCYNKFEKGIVMNNIKQVNQIVRFGDIKRVEREGNIPNFEQIEVSGADILAKSNNVTKLKECLIQLLLNVADEYYQLSYTKEEDIKRKVSLLVDIEELVKTIGRLDNRSWESMWHKAKMSSMQSFAMYARVGEPNLKGCVIEYITYKNYDDLCCIETAVFDELKKLNMDYIKFQNKRKLRQNNQGRFRDGYYLKSIEYANIQEQSK